MSVFIRKNAPIIVLHCSHFLKFSLIYMQAAPVAEWVRSLYFSALNHSIISPLCLV